MHSPTSLTIYADCIRKKPPLQLRGGAAEVHLTVGFQTVFFMISICADWLSVKYASVWWRNGWLRAECLERARSALRTQLSTVSRCGV